MLTITTLLKLAALFTVILLPLIAPKKKKAEQLTGLSHTGVNAYGYLQSISGNNKRHPIQ